MVAALLAALTSATTLILDKINLSREKIKLEVFLPIGFVLIFALAFIFVPSLGRVHTDLLLLPNTMFLFFLMLVIAMASNALFYQGLQKETAHQHELLLMTLPLITSILGAIFYPAERDGRVFILTLIASVALLFSKGEKEHFFSGKTSYNTMLAVVLMATESVIIRELLFTFTPVALYAARTFFLAIFFLLYYRPSVASVKPKQWWLLIGSSVLGVVHMVALYYSYSELGIVYTTLVTILAPVIVFLASWEVLHERIRPRAVISALIILVCVTIATVIAFG